MKLQIYIIFHRTIYDECYSEIPQEYLDKYFTFIAVNEKIEKIYKNNKYKIINEWELPHYKESFQNSGYSENSAIYHIYANNLHKNYDYIGFFQYDMIFKDNFFDLLENITSKSNNKISFELHGSSITFSTLYNDIINKDLIEYIINDYESYFYKKCSRNKTYPVFNAYIIPSESYDKCMGWVTLLYDKIYDLIKNPPSPPYLPYIGGVYERIMALFIGEEFEERYSLNIIHEHEIKNKNHEYNTH